MPRLFYRLSCVALASVAAASSSFAHDPGLSSADVDVTPQSIAVSLVFNERDWASTGISTPDQIRGDCIALAWNGAALTPVGVSAPASDHIQNVSVTLTFPNPGPGNLTVTSLLFDRLPFGHRQFIRIEKPGGPVLAERMVRQDDPACQATLVAEAAPSAPSASFSAATFLGFLALGIRHILTGYDHMLFLAGLLLVCTGFRQAAGVITWFTVAHSITLLLSALNLVVVSSRIVEPAVAASIAYVGVEDILRPGNLRWRGPIAFAFGLVHGLGFAGILRSMAIGSAHGGLAIPLVAFNGGVEIGQLAVALSVLPVIFILRQQPRFLRFGVPAVALVIALLGACWFLQRTILA